MTKISVYNIDENVTADDKWIGTDVNTYNRTKNFTARKLSNYFNGSQVINTGVDLLYKYFTIDPSETRPTGTLSFETEIGPTVNFSAISTFLLSNTTLKGNYIVEFFDFLVGKNVLLYKAKNINLFGNYKILSVEEYLPEPNFFIVNVEFVEGNGVIEEDEDYMISLIGSPEEQSLQDVTDIGSTTTNAIYISGITNDYGLVVETSSNNYPSIYVDNGASGVNANGLEVNSFDGAGAKIYSQNGVGIRAESASGIPIVVFGNGNNTASIDVNLGNTNKGVVIDSGTSSTGNPIEVNKNGVNKLTVNQAGEITAAEFIKAGGTGANALLDNGDTIALTSIESATTSSITADLEVGGIADQQVIPIGTNLQEFATLLLNKTYYPELIDPTFSLTSNAGVIEIGSSTAFTLTFTYNDGNILGATVGGVWLPTSSQGGRAGSAISYTINGTTQAGNTLSVSPVLLAGGNPFSGTVTYGAGIQPLDSKGFDYDEEYPAGTSPLSSVNIQGIYPYFWYKSSSIITAAGMQTAIANGTATKVISSSTGTITIDFNAAGEYLAFAYPSTSTTKTIWFVTTLNSGTIPGGVFGSSTTLPCNSPTSLWSNVSYKIHTTAGLITELDPMQLRNS
jgi:hypothetical protein